ncbi:type II toxin-antitoxin system prevent-host-death family antitoxin [Streptomyces sp. A5-4]|uniref:type II toxin-antitoxin system prevent-host-death family antitoxin n=1 Tax=Streptomyces sp. A5-4 TaxID=3384771 RepID=UPI003DA881BB
MTDTSTRNEHEERIADVRNSFAEAVGRARYSGEVTVLTSRGKRAAAIVPMEFYERALAALGETAVRIEKQDA